MRTDPRAGGPARFLWLALLAAGCGGAASTSADRPHVLLVTVDTLRADHLSVHGYARETSPRIDAFARSALHYTDMVTVLPKTGPSIATHLSGVDPCQHQVTANRLRIPDEVPLVAETFRAAGYETVAWVSNPVLSPEKGFDRGFERYEGFAEEGAMSRLQRQLLRWVEERDWSRPTFTWVHYIDPHGPYTPPPEYAGLFTGDELSRAETRRLPTYYEPLQGWPVNYVLGAIPRYQLVGSEDRVAAYVAAYDAEIRYMDAAFGELLDGLRARGVYDGTAIVLTADHGESLGEHDYWFEHGWYAYEATLHVPMIVKPVGAVTPRVIDSQVSNLDTTPTLLAAAGLPVPAQLQGASLLTDPGERGPLLIQNTSTYPDRYLGVRLSGLKYLREARGGRELYALEADPREERNLVEERGAEARRLDEALRDAVEACAAIGTTEEVTPGSEAARQLEALGYTE